MPKPTLISIFAATAIATLHGAATVQTTTDNIPLAFTRAAGSSSVRYSAYGRGMSVQMTRDGAYLIFDKTTLPIRVAGMPSKAAPTAVDRLPGTANFLLGKDPKQWRTNVETYRKIAYRGVRPGIDHLLRQFQKA